MDRRDDDSGAIAWPGFVDILSAVIIMFIFFVMILAIVMYVLSVEYKKNLAQQNEERLSSMLTEELKEYVELIDSGEITIDKLKEKFELQTDLNTMSNENKKLTKENKQLNQDIDELTGALDQVKADLAGDMQQETLNLDGYLIISFTRNDISLSDETKDLIRTFINQKVSELGTRDIRVLIEGADNPDAPTINVSRELSLGRSLNIRNVAINENIDASQISIKYIDGTEINDSYNWVRVGVEAR